MKYLHNVFVAKKVIKGGKVDAIGQRVHQNGIAVVIAGAGKLDQAKLGVIGPLAQKLGIDGDEGVTGGGGAIVCQRSGRFDDLHQSLLVRVRRPQPRAPRHRR